MFKFFNRPTVRGSIITALVIFAALGLGRVIYILGIQNFPAQATPTGIPLGPGEVTVTQPYETATPIPQATCTQRVQVFVGQDIMVSDTVVDFETAASGYSDYYVLRWPDGVHTELYEFIQFDAALIEDYYHAHGYTMVDTWVWSTIGLESASLDAGQLVPTDLAGFNENCNDDVVRKIHIYTMATDDETRNPDDIWSVDGSDLIFNDGLSLATVYMPTVEDAFYGSTRIEEPQQNADWVKFTDIVQSDPNMSGTFSIKWGSLHADELAKFLYNMNNATIFYTTDSGLTYGSIYRH